MPYYVFSMFCVCVNDIDVADDNDQCWEFVMTLNRRFYRFHDTREFLGEQRN